MQLFYQGPPDAGASHRCWAANLGDKIRLDFRSTFVAVNHSESPSDVNWNSTIQYFNNETETDGIINTYLILRESLPPSQLPLHLFSLAHGTCGFICVPMSLLNRVRIHAQLQCRQDYLSLRYFSGVSGC
jgi:hypothetical protein